MNRAVRSGKVKTTIALTKESHWRLHLHALIEEKSPSEILNDLIQKNIPGYRVNTENGTPIIRELKP